MKFIVRQKTSAKPTTPHGPRLQAPGVGTTGLSQRGQPAQAGPRITVRKKEGPSTLSQIGRGASAGTQALRFAGDPSLGGGVGLLGTVAPWLTDDPKKLQAIQAGTRAYGVGKAVVKRAGADKAVGLAGSAGMTKMAPGAAPFLAEATGGTGMLYKMPQWAGGGGGVTSIGAGTPTIKPPAKTSWGQYAGKAFSYLGAAVTGAQALKGIASGEKGAYASAAMSAASLAHPAFAGIALASWAVPKIFGSKPKKITAGGTLQVSINPKASSVFELLPLGTGPAQRTQAEKAYLDYMVDVTRASFYPYIGIYKLLSPEQQAQIQAKMGSFNISTSARSRKPQNVYAALETQAKNIGSNVQKKLDPIFESVLTPEQKADLYSRGQSRGPTVQVKGQEQARRNPNEPLNATLWPGANNMESFLDVSWAGMSWPYRGNQYGRPHTIGPRLSTKAQAAQDEQRRISEETGGWGF